MSLKNFFDFNLQALKQFLTANLNIEEKKNIYASKTALAGYLQERTFRI